VGKEFCLQFGRHIIRLKTSHYFTQEFDATNFSERSRNQAVKAIRAILHDSIISIVTALNS